MESVKKRYRSSIMTYISLSMTSIIAIGLLTIFISFWITELADKDAQAINLSGSMRMQTYRIALTIEQENFETAAKQINQLNQTWKDPLFNMQRSENNSQKLNQLFTAAHNHWTHVLKPMLEDYTTQAATGPFPTELIARQVQLTDELVNAFQDHAEGKIKDLRAIQLFALFITISVGAVIFYITKNRIETPLSTLTEAAEKIGKGDYGHQVRITGRDELGLLGAVINEMSRSIQYMYMDMDKKVKDRTRELSEHNISLSFLFKIARSILDSQNQEIDYQDLLTELGQYLGQDIDIEICLFTAHGQIPYLHIAPDHEASSNCSEKACAECQGHASFCALDGDPAHTLDIKLPIIRKSTNFGVINLKSAKVKELPEWQHKLLQSVADQFAMALSLSEQKDQEHRLTMLNERNVIARELHDSLAQALSYLQIQATRLQKNHDRQNYEAQQAIIDELKGGLSSAYRQLRELLTTFRLKIDSEGLETAIKHTVEQLAGRTSMDIKMQYQVANLPLTPTEEIHLLQIIREGLQNAVNHSMGSKIDLSLVQHADKSISLIIEDDGIGIPDSPEKLNHYGLAIMKERSKHLSAEIDISSPEKGGTALTVTFMPQYLSTSKAV